MSAGGHGDFGFSSLSEVGAMKGSEQRKDRPALTQVFIGTLLRLQELQSGSGRIRYKTEEEVTALVQVMTGQWHWRSGPIWHLFWQQSG